MFSYLYNDVIRTPHEQEQLNRQLRRLNTDEFAVLRRFIKHTIVRRLDTLSQTTNVETMWRMQGQVKALEDLLEAVEKSTQTS